MYNDFEPQADYQTVKITADKPENYTCEERRAELYERIKENGFGGLPTYRDLGKEYDNAPSVISDDMKELRKYILKHDFASEGYRSKIVENLNWALEEARNQNDHEAASRIANRLNNYLQSIGVEQEEPDKVKVEEEVSHSFREAFEKHHGGEDNKEMTDDES